MDSLVLKIDCTKKHLIKSVTCGYRNSYRPATKHCWVAQAIREIMPTALVFPSAIYLDSGKLIAHLPQFVSERIRWFDSATPKERITMQPFSFEINLDSEQIDAILESNGWSIGKLMQNVKDSETLELA